MEENTLSTQALFYRGQLDDKVSTASNGARVNSDYAAFVADGPWAEVQTWEVGPRIHSITGYGIANHTFIEGETGLILVDTGQSMGAGFEVLKMKQAFSDKPVVAIIYTHHHYTRGTRAIVESYPDISIPIYAHPDVERNTGEMFSYLAPGRFLRGFKQFGEHLPRQGPDASFGITEPSFDEASLNASGHLPLTHPVADGEAVDIDGLKFVFHHAVADTEDSLIIEIPELDAVVHNTAVMPFMFPLYTLRGEVYRSAPEVIDSVDKLRSLKPEYLIGCHGIPVTGRDKAYALATAHRDALALVYQQTVRGINQGLGPDEIAQRVRLPDFYHTIPELFAAYVDLEHMVRGIYRGLVGWWANDTADLHPPAAEELGQEIVQGFGGMDALLQRVNIAIEQGRYNLAAKLASYALAAQAENAQAAQAKATALRKMAYATPTGIQTRNFLLTEALQLEGKIAPDKVGGLAPAILPAEAIMALPPGTFLEGLAYAMDAGKAAELDLTVKIAFRGKDPAYTLAIRHGAAEFLPAEPSSHDLDLVLERSAWAEIVTGQKRLKQLLEEGSAELRGDATLQQSFMAAFADVF